MKNFKFFHIIFLNKYIKNVLNWIYPYQFFLIFFFSIFFSSNMQQGFPFHSGGFGIRNRPRKDYIATYNQFCRRGYF